MSTLLQEADKIAGEDRSRDYGHPYDNCARIAAMWNTQLAPKLTTDITVREVALMMIALKLAREINSPKRDNLVDIAGYAKCADMVDERIKEMDEKFNRMSAEQLGSMPPDLHSSSISETYAQAVGEVDF